MEKDYTYSTCGRKEYNSVKTATFSTNQEERKLLGAMRTFANLKRITSAAQVERLFAGIKGWRFASIIRSNPDGAPFRDNDQPKLRNWLTRITKSERERLAVAAELRPFLAAKVKVRLVLDEALRLRVDYEIDGVEAGFALAVALILDTQRDLTSRLQQCDAPACGRFQLDLETKGRPSKYCNADHRRDAEYAERRKKRKRR